MAITFTKTEYTWHTPEIWRGECKILPGGFQPVQSFDAGVVIHRGTPIYVDFDAMTAAVCKTAYILADSTSTEIYVAKGTLFSAGDTIANESDSSVATITAVDTSNDEYDILTLDSALTSYAEGDIVVEADTDGAALYTPNAVVGAAIEFDGKGLPAIDAAYEAVVLYPSLVTPVLDGWLNGICLAANPNIIFIKQ